jgi:hypothetical protein
MPKPKEGPKKSTVQPSRKNPRPPQPKPQTKPRQTETTQKYQPRPQPRPVTKPQPQTAQKHQPKPQPRPQSRPQPRPQSKHGHVHPRPERHTPKPRVRRPLQPLTPPLSQPLSPMLMPPPWKVEQEAMERQRMDQYQSVVDAQLRNYADRMSIAYQISIDPRQKKANDVMREEDLGHVDTIYTEEDLKDIEEMFGPFGLTETQNNRSVLNPMQFQALRERIAQGRKETKKRSTFKARKHAGKGTGF